MQLYEVTKYEGAQPSWHRTLAEAHADAKLSAQLSGVLIALRDYPSDQQVFCDLFNGVRPEGTLKRSWRLTARGGLQELDLDAPGEEVPLAHQTDKWRKHHAEMKPPQPAEPPDQFWARLTKKE